MKSIVSTTFGIAIGTMFYDWRTGVAALVVWLILVFIWHDNSYGSWR